MSDLGPNSFDDVSLFSAEGRELLNRIAAVAGHIERMATGENTESQITPGGINIAMPPPPTPRFELFAAQLTVNNRDGSYEFVEKAPTGAGGWGTKDFGTFYVAAGARRFYRSGTCYEINANATIVCPKTVQVMVKHTSGHSPQYSFEYCCLETSSSSSSSSGEGGYSRGTSWTQEDFFYRCETRGDCICLVEVATQHRLTLRRNFTVVKEIVSQTVNRLDCCWERCVPPPYYPPSSGSDGMSYTGSTGESSASGDELVHVWRPCGIDAGGSYIPGQDILLPPLILEIAQEDFVDPAIKIAGSDKCYYWAGSAWGNYNNNAVDGITITSGCSEGSCGTAPCVAACEQVSTRTVTVDITNHGCPGTFPDSTSLDPAGFSMTGSIIGTPLWTWLNSSSGDVLRVYCDGNSVFARLSNGAQTAHFGAVGGVNGGYADVTAYVTCDGENLRGTFTLVNTTNFCGGGAPTDPGNKSVIVTL